MSLRPQPGKKAGRLTKIPQLRLLSLQTKPNRKAKSRLKLRIDMKIQKAASHAADAGLLLFKLLLEY